MELQRFGGNWTEEKLEKLRKYLVAYSTIMNKYHFAYAYIDAFAGTGYRTLKADETTGDVSQQKLMFPELIEPESRKFIDGSARIALQTIPRFSKYIFIEKDANKIPELNKLKLEFPELESDIEILNSDANLYLNQLCKKNWSKHRALLFLDPFGMQIPWTTIVAIANTQAIDLWYLFPVGIAINRLLKRDGNIQESIRKKLNETFGTEDWYDTFYKVDRQTNLFGDYSLTEKNADCKLIGEYFAQRLETVFAGVAKNPLLLLNSTNTPLYLLCFASSNPKGAPTAIKIAQDILKK